MNSWPPLPHDGRRRPACASGSERRANRETLPLRGPWLRRVVLSGRTSGSVSPGTLPGVPMRLARRPTSRTKSRRLPCPPRGKGGRTAEGQSRGAVGLASSPRPTTSASLRRSSSPARSRAGCERRRTRSGGGRNFAKAMASHGAARQGDRPGLRRPRPGARARAAHRVAELPRANFARSASACATRTTAAPPSWSTGATCGAHRRSCAGLRYQGSACRRPRDPRPRGADAVSWRASVVTGGVGFIGYHVTRALLSRGDDELVVDDSPTPPYPRARSSATRRTCGGEFPACGSPSMRHRSGCAAPLFDRRPRRCCIGRPGGCPAVFAHPARYARVNVEGTAVVHELARRSAGSSASCRLELLGLGNATAASRRARRTRRRPEAPYAASKRGGRARRQRSVPADNQA